MPSFLNGVKCLIAILSRPLRFCDMGFDIGASIASTTLWTLGLPGHFYLCRYVSKRGMRNVSLFTAMDEVMRDVRVSVVKNA